MIFNDSSLLKVAQILCDNLTLYVAFTVANSTLCNTYALFSSASSFTLFTPNFHFITPCALCRKVEQQQAIPEL